MRRLALAFISSVFLIAALAAQTSEVSGFSVKDARSLGLGGTFLAVSEGCRSLYGNPAGFMSNESELTILAPTAWVYARSASGGMGTFLDALHGDENETLALLADNGMGAGYQLGIGYSGKGLGLGFYVTQDSYAEKQAVDLASLPDVVIDSDFQMNIVLGLALPVKFLGLPLTVGGNLRPFFRATGQMALVDANRAFETGNFSAFFGQDAIGGFGLAVDLGARLELGAFTAGLVVRDIAPAFSVSSGALGDLLSSLGSGSGAGTLALTPNFAAGLQYHPDLGGLSRFLDPRILVELQDPVSVIRGGESILNLLHVGAEIKTLSFLSLRAGLNEGRFSAGVGFDLLFLELNAAVYTEELDGGASRGGMILEAAIRL